jgi:carboxyl-terminal processing protease
MAQRGFRLRTVALLTLIAVSIVPATRAVMQNDDEQAATGKLTPTEAHRDATEEIVERLEHHYRELPLDNDLSIKVLDRYLGDLDPNRAYFTQGDIDRFNRYRKKLDDQLEDGDLSAGFEIFNVYQERMRQRLDYLLARLDDGLDSLSFEDEESILLDRSEAPWAADEDELNDLWRRRLENAVLSMRLNDLEDEEILERLERRYKGQLSRVEQSTSEDVFQAYINALTHTFDPHTAYFTPHASENFDISMSRSLEGIGAVLQAEDEYTKVIRLVAGGPASKAGQLKPADRIIGVGQGEQGEIENVISMRLDQVVNRIRGPKGSVVRLEIIPAGSASEHDTRVISITRNKVELEERAAQKKVLTLGEGDNRRKLGVIQIPAFYLDFEAYRRGDPDYTSTTRDVARLLLELREEGIDGLVIDLRDNGGGSLQEATQLVSLFINQGPTVQVRDYRNRVDVQPDQFPGMLYDGPMAVLVNRYSASASEIFAGALQDYGRALVVGSQTFGKGTVQSLMDLSHGELKMTHAKFYRVSGASNQHRGILPDIDMPYVVDKTEIGESALPNALPWDVIEQADFEPLRDLERYMGTLQSRHQSRIAEDPEFEYVRRQLAMMEDNRQRLELSLQAETRRAWQAEQDKRRLDIENDLRRSRGEEPVDTIKELNAIQERRALESGNAANDDSDEPDPWLRETGQVLSDLISLMSGSEMVAETAP